ncbi:hypothetical protein ACQEU3_46785 [Spirillospora sp. CA-253888]
MPPRADDVAAGPSQVTVHLRDMEPTLGLIAACSRLCAHLTPAAYEAMGEGALGALQQVQAILWRLEHARVEPVAKGE